MSSPVGPQPPQSGFLSRWIPSSSRAGVFLSGSPGEASSVRSSCTTVAQDVSLEDSFCSQFAPLPVSRSSSLDSVVHRVSEMAADAEPLSGEVESVHNVLRKTRGLPLMAKLEQLKQLQQRMQEQLKAHQLEQLQKLHSGQQMFLGVVQTGGAENSHKMTDMLQRLQTAATHSKPQPSFQQPQEATAPHESSVCDHESSSEQPSSGHDQSLPCFTEDQSMYRQERTTEPQDRPIISATSGKTFEEMLEEQLKLENERLNKGAPAEAAKAKRPFLRRGEGLARFTKGKIAGSPGERTTHSKPSPRLDPPTSQSQAIRSLNQSSEAKRPSSKSAASANVVIQRKTAVLNKENFPQSKALVPVTKMVAKPHILGANQGQNVSQHLSQRDKKSNTQPKTTCDDAIDLSKLKPSARVGGAVDPRACVAENSFEVWLAERGERWEKEHHRECVELGEFELLERAADELSFSSNSSFMHTLLGRGSRRLSSTPVKSPPQPKQDDATCRGVNDQQHLPELPLSLKENVGMNQCPEEEEEEDKTDEEGSGASLCSSTEFHQTAFGPSQPFSQCFQVPPVPPYNKHSYQDRGGAASPAEEEQEENSRDSTLVDIKGHIDFDDDDTWNEPDDLTCVSTKTDNRPGRALVRKVAASKVAEPDVSSVSTSDHETGPPPTCKLVAKLFPALKPKPCPPPTVTQDPKDTNNEQGTVQSRLLRERLVELETEIERFKAENASLSRLRQENEDIGENLRKERAEFQQSMKDELAKWEELKREETRKLQREKKLFEKHAAAVRARPDKQERDEIQSLRQQLKTVQEDLRKREARWTSTHHRLRQQLDSLSTENGALRDQVRMLEKLRLTAWKNAESEREKEKERGRSITSSSSVTVQKRTKSKSPSSSIKSSSSRSPDLQNPPKAAAGKSKVTNTQIQKEAHPVAVPQHVSDGQILTEETSQDFISEVDTPSDFTAQSEVEQEEITHVDGKIEKVLPDGVRLIVFPNGTRKELSADGLSVKVTFFNGDIKHVMPDQRVIYYYAGAQTTHTTYPDGVEVLQFPNNQIEKHFPDGRKEITFPDQTVKNLYPDGREESVFADGTIIQQNPDGSKEIQFNTGQRELHTADFKRREYPDGTVKTVYADGRQETRYPSGRLRLKDPQGRVVMDTIA